MRLVTSGYHTWLACIQPWQVKVSAGLIPQWGYSPNFCWNSQASQTKHISKQPGTVLDYLGMGLGSSTSTKSRLWLLLPPTPGNACHPPSLPHNTALSPPPLPPYTLPDLCVGWAQRCKRTLPKSWPTKVGHIHGQQISPKSGTQVLYNPRLAQGRLPSWYTRGYHCVLVHKGGLPLCPECHKTLWMCFGNSPWLWESPWWP